MESVFCQWVESDELWTCAQCGAVVSRAAVPKRPFSACRLGAERNGVPFRGIVEAPKFRPRPSVPSYVVAGPGSELKRMLARLGLRARPGCKCTQRMVQMNLWGIEECERRVDEIVGWLREEAEGRRLPFLEVGARMIVRRAIANAKRKSP